MDACVLYTHSPAINHGTLILPGIASLLVPSEVGCHLIVSDVNPIFLTSSGDYRMTSRGYSTTHLMMIIISLCGS